MVAFGGGESLGLWPRIESDARLFTATDLRESRRFILRLRLKRGD
jgi:hypothetical protein